MFIHVLAGGLIFFIFGLLNSWKWNSWKMAIGYIFFGAFVGLFPDILSFLLCGKITTGKWSHKHRDNISHSLFLPLAVFCIFIFWNWRWATLLSLTTLTHPLLDLFGIGWGVKLFYPFSQTTYKLFYKGKIINAFTQEEIDKEAEKYGDEYWKKNIYDIIHSFNIIGALEWFFLLVFIALLVMVYISY